MKKLLLNITLIAVTGIIYSCYEVPPVTPAENQPPRTFVFLFPDSSISQQQSSIRLSWWGDDPDGLVIGYYISMDGLHWQFTTSNDSVISFPIVGSDTSYIFRVAAVDNSGNQRYDTQVFQNGINFGPEPFTDLNDNGVWDDGEPFIDIGLFDPEPATILLPLKNTPPVVRFLEALNGNTIAIPETTFSVASFGWTATDLDGDETISNIYIALNDTAQKISLPGNTRFITVKAAPPFASDIVEAEIFIGASTVPYSVKLPNFRLDSENVFFVFAEDIAGSISQMIQMPSATAEKRWFVRKPKGEILIVDDYAAQDAAASFYYSVFDSLGLLNKTDIWDIKLGKTSQSTPPLLLPRILSPMFTETLKLFKYVFWYSDVDPTLDAAQLATQNYLSSGGRILFSMIFPPDVERSRLGDFLPVDSVGSAFDLPLFSGTEINPTSQASALGYPFLRAGSQMGFIRNFYPSPFSAISLYVVDNDQNKIIGFKSTDSKLVFMGIPLHRANGDPFNIKGFFEKVFFDEFGVTR